MKRVRRLFAPLLVAALASVALAQPAPPPPPLPPPPLPAEGATTPALPPVAGDPDLEPQVTIIRQENETREEVRIGGELKFVKVTPAHGRPYYLVPNSTGTAYIRRNSLDTSLSVPLWVLFSW